MAYIGQTPSAVPLDGSDIADDIVDSQHYAAGSIDTAHLADDQITLAKMAAGTDGNIISYDASGNPVAIATGSDGQVLTSTGAGSPPAFEAAAAGGKVLQVVQSGDMSSIFVSTSQTLADVGITLNITPSASNSKILLQLSVNFWLLQGSVDYGNGIKGAMYRDSTQINEFVRDFDFQAGGDRIAYAVSGQLGTTLLDSPSSTSQITYKMMAKKTQNRTATIKIPYPNSANPTQFYNHCRLVATEIGA